MLGNYKVMSATLRGVDAQLVAVEISIRDGIPGMAIVGMPDAAVQEARERVKGAIKACGYTMPRDKIVVNLAPGSMKKTGPGFDLPIALGILAASGQISREGLSGKLAVGELSLDGSVRDVPGMLAFQVCAQQHGYALLCPSNTSNIMDIDGLAAYGVQSLVD